MTDTKIVVLGAEYNILFRTIKDDKGLEQADGYLDYSSKKIVIGEQEDDFELECFEEIQKKAMRHEIIHAFFFESGLGLNFENKPIGIPETIVDWFAIQAPKIYKVFKDLDLL